MNVLQYVLIHSSENDLSDALIISKYSTDTNYASLYCRVNFAFAETWLDPSRKCLTLTLCY